MSEAAQPGPARFAPRLYGRLLAGVAATAVALAAAGALVATLRGDGSWPAAAAAVAVAAVASAVAGIPLAYAGGPPTAMLHRALFAMLLRLALVAGLATLCALVLDLPRGPFLIWLVIAYLALLAVDTAFSVRGPRRPPDRL